MPCDLRRSEAGLQRFPVGLDPLPARLDRLNQIEAIEFAPQSASSGAGFDELVHPIELRLLRIPRLQERHDNANPKPRQRFVVAAVIGVGSALAIGIPDRMRSVACARSSRDRYQKATVRCAP